MMQPNGVTHSVRDQTVSATWGQRGMTLAEVLVALPILTIGVLALLATIPYSATNTQAGLVTSTATFLANNRIDAMKAAALRDAPAPPTPPDPAVNGFIATYTNPPAAFACTGIANDPLTPLAGTEADVAVQGFTNTGYSRVTTVADVAAGVCPVKLVTVTVSYRGAIAARVAMQIAPR